MLRLLEFIISVLVIYKIFRMFATDQEPQKVQQPREKQNIHFNDTQNNPSPNSRFNSAEPIDYEEVK